MLCSLRRSLRQPDKPVEYIPLDDEELDFDDFEWPDASPSESETSNQAEDDDQQSRRMSLLPLKAPYKPRRDLGPVLPTFAQLEGLQTLAIEKMESVG